MAQKSPLEPEGLVRNDAGRLAAELTKLPLVFSGTVESGLKQRSAEVRLFQSSYRSAIVRLEQSVDTAGVVEEVAMIADEILVGLQKGKTPNDLAGIIAQSGSVIARLSPTEERVLLKLPSLDTQAYYAALETLKKARSIVKYAEPNFFIPNALNGFLMAPTPANDASYADGSQWALNNSTDVDIDAPEAWTMQHDATGIIVAVIDSGIDLDHPDLDDNLWHNSANESGYDFVDNDADPDDDNGHGTHVAGIIGAEGNNSIGVSGVAWDVQLMAVKVADSNGDITVQALADGIDYARISGADLINLSLGGSVDSTTLRTAMEAAETAGILCIIAAGNEFELLDTDSDGWPARYNADFDNLIVVGSSNLEDDPSLFAYQIPPDPSWHVLWGTDYSTTLVDVSAPGSGILGDQSDSILSTYFGGGYGRLWGTSMSAPHVTGAAALALARFGTLAPSELKARIVHSVDVVADLSPVNGKRPANIHRFES